MFDEEKIKSIIPRSQDIVLVFFFKKIYFQLYSNILNIISKKTDYVSNLSVLLINLLTTVVGLDESL